MDFNALFSYFNKLGLHNVDFEFRPNGGWFVFASQHPMGDGNEIMLEYVPEPTNYILHECNFEFYYYKPSTIEGINQVDLQKNPEVIMLQKQEFEQEELLYFYLTNLLDKVEELEEKTKI